MTRAELYERGERGAHRHTTEARGGLELIIKRGGEI